MALRKISLHNIRRPAQGTGDISGFNLLPWQGNAKAKVMLVCDPIVYNGDEDAAPAAVKPMNGKTIKDLAPFMKNAGLRGEDLCIVAACGPVHEDVWKSESKLNKKLKEDNAKFMEAYARLKPQLIISQGKAAIRQVLNRPAKITKLRGVAFRDDHLKTLVMPTLGIAHVSRVPEHGELFAADLATASRIIKRGFKLEEEKTPTNYKWVTDLSFLLAKKPKVLAVDTEGTCFGAHEFPHWYYPQTKLLTVQLSVKPGEAFVVPIDYPGFPILPATRAKLVSQLKRLLEDPEVQCVGQNLKFDYLILLKKLGIKMANYAHDILLMAHMLNENMLSKALDDIARVYLPHMSGYKDEFIRKGYSYSRMDLVKPDDLLLYSGGDTDAVIQLFPILLKKLQADPKLFNCYMRVVMPGLRAFCDIEQEGFRVNRLALEMLRRKVAASQVVLKNKLLAMIPRQIKDEYRNTGVGLKLTRDALLRAWLFTHPRGMKLKPRQFTKGTKEPSVSTKTHLPYFVTEHPAIADIMKYVKNDKLLTTYIGEEAHTVGGRVEPASGFWQYIYENYVRPSYKLHGTVTGRTASSDPNGQNFPKRGDFAKEYRAIFEAPKGWVLIEADYSQLELRIAGISAREPLFLKTYREGVDIHCLTASIVMGISLPAFMELKESDPEKFDLNRFRAKAVNFGFIYGMGWKKFMMYAKTEYGIDYTEREAQTIREKFFGRYAALSQWHQDVRDFVREHHYVRCFDGRLRHLPAVVVDDDGVRASAERQAVNSPVQGFGSDLGVMALARINSGMDRSICRVVGFVHDAVIAIAKVGHEMEAARQIKHYMETNPLKEWFGFVSPIPIVADIKLGYNLAKMIELKKAWLDDKNVTTYEHVKALASANDNKKKEPPKFRMLPRRVKIEGKAA